MLTIKRLGLLLLSLVMIVISVILTIADTQAVELKDEQFAYQYSEDEPVQYINTINISADFNYIMTAKLHPDEIEADYNSLMQSEMIVDFNVFDHSWYEESGTEMMLSVNDISTTIAHEIHTKADTLDEKVDKTHNFDKTFGKSECFEMEECNEELGRQFDSQLYQTIPFIFDTDEEYPYFNDFSNGYLKFAGEDFLRIWVIYYGMNWLKREGAEETPEVESIGQIGMLNAAYYTSLLFPEIPAKAISRGDSWKATLPMLDFFGGVLKDNTFTVVYTHDGQRNINGVDCLMIHGETEVDSFELEDLDYWQFDLYDNTIYVDICFNIPDGVVEFAEYELMQSLNGNFEFETSVTNPISGSYETETNYSIEGKLERRYGDK